MSGVSNAIYQLNNTIESFESKIDVHVKNIHSNSISIDETTEQIYAKIVEFHDKMEQGEQKQLAHENIIRIEQVIKEQFGSYESIRRTIMGVVRDFDINLVRNTTIQELSEELWITNSRYWLSYALIAITAWVNNYPEVARNALSECGRKDSIKATLFFCLLNLRFGRMEAARKWFNEYLRTLDPTVLQQETAVMLQAFLNGIFGKDKALEYEITQVIDQWIRIINESVEISGELIDAYETYIGNVNPNVRFDYVNILQYCSNANQLATSYRDVSKYDALLERLAALEVETEIQNDDNYAERVDAVLISLISNYDAEELDLRNQQEYFNLIVKNDGQIDAAESQFEAEMALQNENFNIGKQMIRWAIYDEEETDTQVRLFGLRNTKPWLKDAVERWSQKLYKNFPTEYKLQIDTWSCTSNGSDLNEQLESLENHYEANKFQYMFVNTPNILALLIFIVSAALAFATLYALIATALSAGFLVWRVLKAIKEFPLRIAAAKEVLQDTLAEIAEFRQYFDDNAAKKDDILSKLEFI